ncbi:MAG: 4-hydroxy-tetrahydrodipicolinate reductase [Acidimicrobiia bacterium]
MTKQLRVGVLGAAGRMGRTVCEAVLADPTLVLAAAADPSASVIEVDPNLGVDPETTLVCSTTDELLSADVSVVVDFTHIDAARMNLRALAAAGVHAVVGTSGFSESDYETFGALFTQSNCVIVPNFAIGAVLMMRFAELAAPFFETGEIIELHHNQKIDAPSGTAVATANRMAAVQPNWAADPTTKQTIEGARGAAAAGGIPVHSLRLAGLVAHQEVILGTAGQTLTIRHDSLDRSSFMPGVVLAIKAIGEHPGLTVGLDALLGI